MTKAHKLSVALTARQIKALKRYAAQGGGTASAAVSAAVDAWVEDMKRRDALRKLVESFGPDGQVTDEEYESIRAEWGA